MRKNLIIHHNEWYWGVAETIISNGGRGVCKVTKAKVENDAWLDGLSVVAGSRKKGIGNSLLARAQERAKAIGATRLSLWTEPQSWMREWYERQGFQVVEEDRDRVILSKML